MKKITLLLLIFIPALSFSQADTSKKSDILSECAGKVYSKSEIAPSIAGGIKLFEDSLSSYLIAKKAFPQSLRVTYSFILTTSKNIDNIYSDANDPKFDILIKEFLTLNKWMWKPANQNGENICSFVELMLIANSGKLKVVVTQ